MVESLGQYNIRYLLCGGLTNLGALYLGGNNISDISPLAANTGLGNGDTVNVQSNPLSYQSIHTHIPLSKAEELQLSLITGLIQHC